MTTYHFTLSEVGTGRLLGHGLICPAARYASVRRRDAVRLERRFIAREAWGHITEDLDIGWEKGRVSTESAVAHALADAVEAEPIDIQFLAAPSIAAGLSAAVALDTYLWAQVFP